LKKYILVKPSIPKGIKRKRKGEKTKKQKTKEKIIK